jgi:CRISPR/Cas system CSM-associated protein Csm3 (group 7 of RAMP superfamily)
MNSKNSRLAGKIVLHGQIKTTSPLHIGCSFDERSDMDILLDSNDQPYIPATALIGVLKHRITSDNPDFDKQRCDEFWGVTEDNKGKQSVLKCSDLLIITESPRIIRDGIRINSKTGMVEHAAKYDYEILERGAVFKLNLEMDYTLSNQEFVKKMAATIYSLLKNGAIRLGAKTNSGFGKFSLIEAQTQIYDFDFSNKLDVYYWLTSDFTNKKSLNFKSLGKPFKTSANLFRIDATLNLKNSMIIRSYPGNPEMPDAVHIKSLDTPVLTGTSLKGAIRARAEKIVNTLGQSDDFVKNLFGYVEVDKNDKPERARKGKVRVNETIMPRFIAEIQNRIKIDRFTSGTIEAALFDSMPLFVSKDKKALNIIIETEACSESEAGLLLLVLKDLWSGDLAVGGEKNVGRGVFQGVQATIEWNDESFDLKENLSQISPQTKEKLQRFVDAFVKEVRP